MQNRRRFLQNLGLTGSAIAVPSALLRAGEAPFIDPSGTSTAEVVLTGRVHAAGTGIAGVAVTDGINIVLTDAQGMYQLPSSAQAELVYLSIPAGYTCPVTDGVTVFYKALKKPSGTVTNDFELTKSAADESKHQFLVWADPQMSNKEEADRFRATTVPDVQELLRSYPQGAVFHGIGCGDLVWDKFEILNDYKQGVQATGLPFFNVIGNHDLDLNARTDDYSAMTFKRHFGPTYYSFNRGAAHYIMLDNVFFLGMDKRYIGYLTETQLRWLEQDLSYVKPGSLVFVSMHIPTATGLFKRQKKDEEFGMCLSNRKQLYRILQPYQVHILSGHTHFNENWEAPGIMEHNHGAVCGAWWTGPICSDGTPAGYGVYEVDGTDVKWYYKGTGLPRNKQFRIYKPGRIKSAPGEIAVNVWNWDAKWKVNWYQDGVLKGPMQQRVGLDPMAEELYLGKSLPAKYQWVEPTLNDHLFFAKPSPGAVKISIEVTDRFGTVYREDLV